MRQLPSAVAVACAVLVGAACTLHPTVTLSQGVEARDHSGATARGPLPPHWSVLTRYCTECHNTIDWAGGIAFDALSPARLAEDGEIWERAIRKLRTGMMPPPGEPRPPRAELDGLARGIETRLDQAARQHPMPGSKPLHRLNRTEYANAVRDLIAYDVDVSTLLPADDAAEGFDNIADVLGVSPTLIQAYVSAAMKISRWAVGDPGMPPALVTYDVPAGAAQREHIEGLPLGTRGGIRITHNFPLDAEYEFRVAAGTGFRFAGPAGGPPPRLDITLNGEPVQVPDLRKFRLRVKAGPQTLTVAMVEQRRWEGVDDLYARAQPRRDNVESVSINGPFNATGVGDTPSRRAIFSCYPGTPEEEAPCARQIFTRLARLAFRQPLSPGDRSIEELLEFYEQGRKSGGFEVGIQQGLARLLASPRFLFRAEIERTDVASGTPYRITDVELASRLSFFLWSSIPDETLLSLASEGRLSDPQTLDQQVRRMLADPRSRALVENFAGQWLHLRELHNAQPLDRQFDDNLREAFEQETQRLFAYIVREDRSLLELIDADYTFLNERLARHYGIPNVRGSYMRRVSLPKDSPRRGVLGHGSILTVTSAGNRTSPVMRGAWVMETLLGAPPPRPPPGVEADLKEEPDAAKARSVRERLEQHRTNPTCASCHAVIDPIGFALENFDLIGRWREKDGANPVDSTGRLVDGTTVSGPQDLRRALLSRADSFVTSATEKLLTYALGRRLEYFDQPAVREIVRNAKRENYRFSSLVLGVVHSVPFQMKARRLPADAAPAESLRQASAKPSAQKKDFE